MQGFHVAGSRERRVDPFAMLVRHRAAVVRMAALAVIVACVALAGTAGRSAPSTRPASTVSMTALPVPVGGGDHEPALPQPVHRLEPADLESWLDGMLPAALKQGQVAGAVVSVVQGDRVLLAKGYGFADMARKVPMDPARTLVRPGSTSKLFTWTAVMQLAEQGRIDLNTDVNRYLDFRVSAAGQPITMTDLMTHRAGFEEGLKDAIVADPARLQRLDVFLKGHVRPLLFAPGKVAAYSNYGTALAGYIVQRVSGEPFDAYVARHIFTPLGMSHSTFAQPLPAMPGATMSHGYMSAADAPRPFELISFAPAGSLSSTATDMAQFMIAHLQDGRLGTATILRPGTARLMHTASLPHPAGFDTMAHGFFLEQRNGRTLVGHGGDTIVFHSDLELIPSEQVGIFVSFNSRGQGDAVYGMRERLIDGFMDRYFPAGAVTDPPAIATAKAHGAEAAGRYETSRRVQTGFMSLFYALLGQDVVVLNPDATITLSSAPETRFREIAPYLWREVGGARMLTITSAGGARELRDSRNPVQVLQPVPLRRNAALNLTIFGLALAGLLAAAIAWPIAEGARRVYRQAPALAGRALVARRLVRIAAVADLAYLAAWFVVLKPILGNDVASYTTALDPTIRALQIAGLVPLLGGAVGLWHAWLSLRSRQHWVVKAGAVAICAALLGVVWIAWVGGLMSFTLNY